MDVRIKDIIFKANLDLFATYPKTRRDTLVVHDQYADLGNWCTGVQGKEINEID